MGRQRVDALAPEHARERGVKGRRWRAVGHSTNAIPQEPGEGCCGGPVGGIRSRRSRGSVNYGR
jgi:hypothetical protein